MGMVQVRNVPDELHRELKARAALAGLSLSDYLLRILRREVARPSREQWLRELSEREPVDIGTLAVDLIREARGPMPGDEND